MYGYNGYYGGVYQPSSFYTPQVQQVPQTQPAQNGDNRIWVQGEVGAKAYLITPGSTVALWDSERQMIYIKSVTPNGVPSMQYITYALQAPETPATVHVDNSIGVRVERLEKGLESLKTQMKGMNTNVAESDADAAAV